MLTVQTEEQFDRSLEQQLLSSPHFLNSLRQKILPSTSDQPYIKHEIPIKRVIDQVIRYLMEIIQTLLQEENSNNYIKFIKKNEELFEQIQTKWHHIFQDKIQELKSTIEEKLAKGVIKGISKQSHNNQLKSERKRITETILNQTVSKNGIRKKGSNIIPIKILSPLKGHKSISDDIGSDQLEQSGMVSSLEMNSIASKISDLERQHQQALNRIYSKLEKKIEQNYHDIMGVNVKYLEWKGQVEERLEGSLEGVWNVISDVQLKIAEITKVVDKIQQ